MSAIGLDIGGTSVKAAAFDLASEDIREARSDAYARPDASALRAAVRDAWARAGQPRAECVGLCLPGRFDDERGVIDAAVNLPALVGARPADWLPDELAAARVVITADAEAAALDLARDAPPSQRLLALSIGTGVGVCVLEGRTHLRVIGRSPGRLGQVDVGGLGEDRPALPVGADGGRGSLEAFIGLPALRERFPGHAPETLPSAIEPGDIALRALAQALRIAHAVWAPHRIVLLGGVGIRLSPEAIADLHARTAEDLTSLAQPGWILEQGTTDYHAARGALGLAREANAADSEP
ncbi:MAG: ROK family protein [Planctomycetota bacterium]